MTSAIVTTSEMTAARSARRNRSGFILTSVGRSFFAGRTRSHADTYNLRKMHIHKLNVLCDGNRLVGEVVVPDTPRGLVLFLHGLPSAVHAPDPNDEGYAGVAKAFAERGYAAAWFDMRGKKGKGYFSIEGWVRDARAALDAARAVDGLAALPVVLAGFSAGGAVAVETARRGAPVKALVLLAAPATWVSLGKDPRDTAARIKEAHGMPLAPDVEEDPTAWHAEFAATATERTITTVRTPVLIVHSDDDDVVPVSHADRIEQAAPNAQKRVLSGQGHQLRRSTDALEVTLSWLDRHLF